MCVCVHVSQATAQMTPILLEETRMQNGDYGLFAKEYEKLKKFKCVSVTHTIEREMLEIIGAHTEQGTQVLSH